MSIARIVPSPELASLLDLAVSGTKQGGIPRYVLQGLLEEIGVALGRIKPSVIAAELTDWTPRPDQIWRSGMRADDGSRLTAWRFYQERFEPLPLDERPYAHLLRQNPATKDFYDALCVFLSRNKAKGLQPSSIEQVFPVSALAKGGKLAGDGGKARGKRK